MKKKVSLEQAIGMVVQNLFQLIPSNVLSRKQKLVIASYIIEHKITKDTEYYQHIAEKLDEYSDYTGELLTANFEVERDRTRELMTENLKLQRENRNLKNTNSKLVRGYTIMCNATKELDSLFAIPESKSWKDFLKKPLKEVLCDNCPPINFKGQKYNIRAYNSLHAADINTVGELLQYSKEDLMKFRNMGIKTVAYIEKFIDYYKSTFNI